VAVPPRAGTVILGISIVLWFLTAYPKAPAGATPTAQLAQSFAGQAGHLLEPVIKPLGFDWQIGIGLISSFAAREVFVSTMGVVFNAEADGENTAPLRAALKADLAGRPGALHAAHLFHPDDLLRLRHAMHEHDRGRAARNQFVAEMARFPDRST
jgi:Fe2+ transport system protein B